MDISLSVGHLPPVARLSHAKTALHDDLAPHLSRRCSHIKGHGGVKLSVNYSQRLCNHFAYVARFDVRSYYSSTDQQLYLGLAVRNKSPEAKFGTRNY